MVRWFSEDPILQLIHISHKFGIDFQSSADDIPIRINNEVLLLSTAIREARRFSTKKLQSIIRIRHGRLAQLAERRSPKPNVGGSNPSPSAKQYAPAV